MFDFSKKSLNESEKDQWFDNAERDTALFVDFEGNKTYPDLRETNRVCDGYYAGKRLDPICSEEMAYEYLSEIADRTIGIPLTAIAEFGSFGEDRERLFCSRIRAIYRASVWGQISLLCSGISTRSDLEMCLTVLHDAFCELESEGREFNGFIQKGICIETPMLLYNIPPRIKCDLLCFDFKKLLSLCTGQKSANEQAQNELADSIREVCLANKESDIAIICKLSDAQETIDILKPLSIKKIFLT